MSPRLKSALVLAGVFALGAVTGGSAVHFTQVRRIHAMFDGPPHQARLKGMLAALDREVNLDDTQREKVKAIIAAHETEMKEIRRSAAPRLVALHKQIASEVRAVLRPEQVQSFDQFVKKQQDRAVAAGEMPPEER